MARTRNRPRVPVAQGNSSSVVAVQRTVAASFEGPIPPPDLLAQYSDIIPNGADRILAMAESNAQHRQELESFAVRAEHRRSVLGIGSALIVAVTIAVCGTIVTLSGHPEVGLTMVGVDMVAIVSTFVYGTESRKRERLTRVELMTGKRK